VIAAVRRKCRRHRSTVTVAASLAATLALAFVVIGATR
jgi:hypothetical protein